MKTIIITLLTVLTFGFVNAQVDIEWDRVLGGTGDETCYGVSPTADGGYVLCGYSNSNVSGDKTENSQGLTDYWVVKIDAAGNIQWQNTIGGSGSDVARVIQQTLDGGYIVGGYSNSPLSGDKTEAGRGSNDYWVVKLDGTGSIQWQKTIGGTLNDYLYVIQQTSDTGYILGGASSSNITGDKTEASVGSSDYWIVKLDVAGNIEWQNTIGGTSADNLSSVVQTADGGYLVGGSSNSNQSGDKSENPQGLSDYWIVKLDSAGSIEWQNTIGGTGEDILQGVRQASDGGYLAAGYSGSRLNGDKTESGPGSIDYWIVKLDAGGSIQWQNAIGGTFDDILTSVDNTADGGFIVAGYSNSRAGFDKTEDKRMWEFSDDEWYGIDYWVVKLDSSGGIEWQNTLGAFGDEFAFVIRQGTDGGYLVGGSTEPWQGNPACDLSEAPLALDYWVVKLPEVPDSAKVSSIPAIVDHGREIQIEFTAENFSFNQGSGVFLQNNTNGILRPVFPSGYSYTNDTTVVGTFHIPLFPCGQYDLITECYTIFDALDVSCSQSVSVQASPASASRCGDQLNITFTSEGFEFVQGSSIYLQNGSHLVYPDTTIHVNDSTVVGFFTFSIDDSCGLYSLRHFAVDSFSDVFELLCTECAFINGYAYDDANTNCVQDSGEVPLRNLLVEIRKGSNVYYVTTDNNGYYSVAVDTGTYALETSPPSQIFESSPCSSLSQSATLNNRGDTATVNFPMYGANACSQLWVEVSQSFLRRCNTHPFKNVVRYCNRGNGIAVNAFVDVFIPPILSVVSTSIPYDLPQTGDLYRFQLGNVAPGACGIIYIDINISCDAEIGQTICVEAHIYPDTVCYPINPSWDGSSVDVEAFCVSNDTVQFRISNVGTGDMTNQLNYYIVEDNVMLRSNTFQLLAGGRQDIIEVANGSTFRIDAQQSPGHPGRSRPSATVEGCGTNGSGTVSRGFVNILPQDDADYFVSISCDEVRGSFDPNDKTGYPTGVGSERIISSSTEMEYKIRFQNVGNDTAFNIMVRDTISPHLDITTFELGAASHPYDFRIYGTGILEWRFDNIMLPDSFVNEPESHGFVQFTMAQMPGNLDGTVIKNSAQIYFDNNAPLTTNVEFNTVGDVNKVLSVFENYDLRNNMKIYPNPFGDALTVEFTSVLKEGVFEIYDLQGKLLKRYYVTRTNKFNISGLNLERGMYFYRVIEKNTCVGAGKLVGY